MWLNRCIFFNNNLFRIYIQISLSYKLLIGHLLKLEWVIIIIVLHLLMVQNFNIVIIIRMIAILNTFPFNLWFIQKEFEFTVIQFLLKLFCTILLWICQLRLSKILGVHEILLLIIKWLIILLNIRHIRIVMLMILDLLNPWL